MGYTKFLGILVPELFEEFLVYAMEKKQNLL